ncbi:1-deoxy-D-xylulose-5-phosphate reductoisomerase [Agrobacterium vitis]|uniref:1-deoxy-D-xylulose 5-phosphate reductoisomerase n=1 Tax=Agrobacterium vitis TaxID=373 RepID=A0A368NQ37_AGRVI|nr:1-deoxy-D-xylulose-5-phosphate reductoisomerase [Agrobacterium vitis]KAA3516901.1 1-deoxy-D-xylulose-5-phosphate reductoisomerase [Agrobacterium vitis]KAA3529666.1 1-deoxy-D-xylulose-5-phosphate reductoisomerase [Agrobacterium vitis]MCF1477318.1 1-deoxy-D-xylulose-5-phosphate reductoisomerase [Agrobacterium vitis]MUZ97467.1 1-deoxy-D-xylulose-5-phosphate reductoisomerase [Agrobacterium vitis]MVA28049.1 1-deoxy-D-xylulose-5-phosphate reductoisomerase [Agrobacterium vitis]
MNTATSQPRRLTILGSTGSIGTNTLDVIRQMGGRDRFDIMALTGHGNVALLAEQALVTGARLAVTSDENQYIALKDMLSGSDIDVAAGSSGLHEAASLEADWVMAAIVGTAGLQPTLTAAARGADIALANKECLVSAGELFIETVRKGGGKIIPVDSEHSAIFQCLDENHRDTLERIVLTASGGPFRTFTRQQMADVSVQTARAHPNWSMGLKVSIGSASMFNKALEMIEAKHLFDLTPDQIEVIVHPQSIVHSMVGYRDGSVLAQLGVPDMRTAIGYALSYPKRAALDVDRLDFTKLARLDFEAPDLDRFPAIRLARTALERGGLQGAVLNAAEECAFEAFVEEKIGFLAMADVVEDVMDHLSGLAPATVIADVFAADAQARRRAQEVILNQGCTG